jgi:hypothetical protein
MTEEEAKTKWCPMVRNPSGYGAVNRGSPPGNNQNCVGSGCMMFRTLQLPAMPHQSDRTEHYCGLAGKP